MSVRPALFVFTTVALMVSTPLMARESLGVFANWGAFASADEQRCYAIAMADDSPFSRERQPYATITTWPDRQMRGQFHARLSRTARQGSVVTLRIGRQNFSLLTRGMRVWAQDRAMDAAISAAMRSATRMRVLGRDRKGRRFTDTYTLQGAATAMDAATLACSGRLR